jgi:serine/threonine protein kinase
MEQDFIGKTIGGYTIVKHIGAGATASVFGARRVQDGEPVAIKILPFHLAAKETLRQRFMREAQMVKGLQHRNILPVYDFGEANGMPYIVMKLVEGGTLDAFIKEGPLPLLFVARTTAHLASALDYAHAQGVIHRDLKPENILFDADANLYLSDFGVARFDEGAASLTGVGLFVGTAAYASPEQCRGEVLTPQSDVYSLCVVLYEMLTGVLPFTGPTGLAIMHQHINEPVPNPLKERADLPLEINDVLRKGLAKLPAVRYQTGAALSGALNQALRRTLGTKPLAENAPPLGPDPKFDRPVTAYAPLPPMPENLLVDLEPTRPTRPPGLENLQARARTMEVRIDPPPVAEMSSPVTNKPSRTRSTEEQVYFWLIVVTVIVAAGLLAVILFMA